MSSSEDEDDYLDDSMDEDVFENDDEDDEDEDEVLEDEISFEPVIPAKDVKKSYEVDFSVHSIQDITSFQNKETKHVAGILGM
jgi:hypothetical protein